MVTDSSPPATKADITLILERMESMDRGLRTEMVTLNEALHTELKTEMVTLNEALHTELKTEMMNHKTQLRGEMAGLRGEMAGFRDEMAQWKDEVKDHFDLCMENALYDFRGAHKDDIENIKVRLTRVETKVGIKA